MASIKHVHKYILRNISNHKEKPRKVYSCAAPDCTHYMPSMGQVIGKKSICWKCGDDMIMSGNIVRKGVVKPKCFRCRKFKGKAIEEVKKQVILDDAIGSLLSGLRGK